MQETMEANIYYSYWVPRFYN